MTPLPLFPLNVVLFPGSRIPLHIFEPRYITMINRCIERQQEFGIILLSDGHLSSIGCTANVFNVVRKYRDGSFDIIVEGGKRFELLSHKRTGDEYLEGTVNIIEDVPDAPGEELAHTAISLYNSFVETMYKGKVEPISMEAERHSMEPLSYFMAEKAGLELPRRQFLLENRSERERIVYIVSHLESAVDVARDFKIIRRLIANDGYLRRSML